MANRFLSNIRINDAYTFPASDGSSGQVITTDGSGNLSFSEAGTSDAASVIYRDNFTGDGSTVSFDLQNSITDEDQTQIYIDGVYQEKDTYSVSGSTITFTTAPISGHSIEVISISAINTGPTIIYQDNFTGNGSATDFTLANAIDNEVKTLIFLNGVYQFKNTYSVDSTTLSFDAAPANGVDIEVISIASATQADSLQAGSVIVPVKNTHNASISKGTPVYISGNVGNSARLQIAPADASNSAKMPAAGLLLTTLAVNAEGYAITGGYLRNITTNTIDGTSTTSNDTVYVKAGGGLTMTKPTGSNLIQNIAKIARSSSGNSGSLLVSSILRTNDIPNIANDHFWLGNSSSVATATSFPTEVGNYLTTNSYATENYVDTEVAGLVASAPTTLDTLNELAAALGDDPNFATTTATSIGLKAPLASPSFTGNVGIGETSPSYKLTVADDTANGRAIQAIQSATSGTNWGFQGGAYGSGATKNIGLQVTAEGASTNYAALFGGGNVGIGTTSPTNAKLVISDTGSNKISIDGGTSQNGMRWEAVGGANGFYLFNGTFGTAGFGLYNINTAQAPLWIQNGGNVGIGTTSPSTTLHTVKATENWIYAETSGTNAVAGFRTSTSTGSRTNTLYRNVTTNLLTLRAGTDDGEIQFIAGGSTAERMRIDSSGNVGIGTTPKAWTTAGGTKALQISTRAALWEAYNGTYLSNNMYYDGGEKYIESDEAAQISLGGDGTIYFRNAVSGTADAALTWNERMRIDSSGNVGIGQTSIPSTVLLDLKEPDAGSDLIIGLTAGTGGRAQIRSIAQANNFSAELSFYTVTGNSTSERMRIDSLGNVGIGITNPDYKLDVAGNFRINEGSAFTDLDIKSDRTSGNIGGVNFVNASDAIKGQIYGHTDGSVKIGTGGTSVAMVLDSSGKVGIGTTSPSAKLEVESSSNPEISIASTAGATSNFLNFKATSHSQPIQSQIKAEDNGNFTADMVFSFKGTGTSGALAEKMRITSGGGLIVGAAGVGDVNNIVNTHLIEGNSQTAGIAPTGFYNNSGTANVPVVNILQRDTSTNSSCRFIQFFSSVTNAAGQSMGGIVGNGANNAQFAIISDIREKENIKTIESSLDKINKLNPVEFDWKKTGEHTKAGFIAQEVEEIFPEYVVENLSNEGEEERKGLTGGMTSGIVAHLVKSIQELKADNDSLKARIETLENN